MAEHYDVTIIAVRPDTHPQALTALGKTIANDPACWRAGISDIGAVNQILIIREAACR